MKLKAAAMYYALTISLVIAVLLSMLLLFAYFNRIHTISYDIENRLINNSLSGLEYLKSETIKSGTYQIDLFNEKTDSVILIKKQWGLFEMLASKAIQNKKSFSKAALFGVKSKGNVSLYLTDNNKSLSICGKTEIKGNAYLPKGGVKRVSIEGKSYLGKELIYGNSFTSENRLPTLNPNFQFQKLDQIRKYSLLESEKEWKEQNEIVNSFADSTIIFYSSSNINLSNTSLKGNIILYSEGLVKVSENNELENVLIIAKAVMIKDGFQGNIHIIGEDSIIIGENVLLNYPSSLLLASTKANKMLIKQNSEIEGVFVINGNIDPIKKSFLTIEEDVIINGDVYCKGIVMHKGKINGSLYCEGFYLKTPSAIYENYLLDAVVDVSSKPKHYLSPNLFNQETIKEVVKWLD